MGLVPRFGPIGVGIPRGNANGIGKWLKREAVSQLFVLLANTMEGVHDDVNREQPRA